MHALHASVIGLMLCPARPRCEQIQADTEKAEQALDDLNKLGPQWRASDPLQADKNQ